jgi:transcriptional/translational regulatory protein YebC/TACO1
VFGTWVNTHEFQASGDKDKGSQLATYEAMAFGEVGVIMYAFSFIRVTRISPSLTSTILSECLTDNSNRTVHRLRELLAGHK